MGNSLLRSSLAGRSGNSDQRLAPQTADGRGKRLQGDESVIDRQKRCVN